MLLMLLEFVTDREKEKFIEIYQYFERKMYAVAFSVLKEQNVKQRPGGSFPPGRIELPPVGGWKSPCKRVDVIL